MGGCVVAQGGQVFIPPGQFLARLLCEGCAFQQGSDLCQPLGSAALPFPRLLADGLDPFRQPGDAGGGGESLGLGLGQGGDGGFELCHLAVQFLQGGGIGAVPVAFVFAFLVQLFQRRLAVLFRQGLSAQGTGSTFGGLEFFNAFFQRVHFDLQGGVLSPHFRLALNGGVRLRLQLLPPGHLLFRLGQVEAGQVDLCRQ